MAFNDLLLKALNKEKTERPPVWLMRQAGRYMPEYMEVRKKVSFLELCKTPELACAVTLQPVDILGADAAILFSDILIPIEPIGVNLSFNPAPVISNPVRTMEDVNRLNHFNPESDAPDVFHSLMKKLTEDTIKYLQNQVKHGCAAIQMFDTWAGILPPAEYKEMVFPYVKEISESISAPFIYFAKDGSAYFDTIKELNCAGIGIDWKISLKEANVMLGSKFSLQGNLDPAILFSNKASIKKYAETAINEGKLCPGHIFNLGHGIMPATPVENVKYLIDVVKGLA